MAQPRTIQIFLPLGDPRGIRVAELTTNIVQVMEVPRPLLADFFTMPEAKQVGLYLLINDEDEESPAAYIGQTGDLINRLATSASARRSVARPKAVHEIGALMFRAFSIALAALFLAACGSPPGPLEGTWRSVDVVPIQTTFRSGQMETMGVIEKVTYKVEGKSVVVSITDGPMKGMAVRYELVDGRTVRAMGMIYRKVGN